VGAARNGSIPLCVKAHNYHILMLNLLRRQPVSRVRLAQLCQVSTTTVTKLVAELLAAGVLREEGTDVVAARAGAGRPPQALHLVPESRYVLGIHLGVREARCALCGLDGKKLSTARVPIQARTSPEQNLARIATAGEGLLGSLEANGHGGRVLGVGVGASGLVDVEQGINVLAPNLGWRNVALRDFFADALRLPVAVDNNVRCMALAESLLGGGRNVRALAYVYGRVGVGAGLVVDGSIYRGAGFGAGEIGHWTMVPKGGAVCRCGNSGCLETLVSEPVIVERARRVDPFVVDQSDRPLQAIFEASRRGHAGLQELLGEVAFYLGIALANLVNVLNPEMIMLGGLFHEGYDLLHHDVEATVHRHAFGGLGGKVSICPATFADESGEIGAAALALDRFFLTQPA
jgi:predicted NBD/HSP70 family sugar kinase